MSNALKGSGRENAVASGVVALAAVMLMIAGVLNLFRGIMAIDGDPVFLTPSSYVFRSDPTGWGWTHLVLAVLAFLTGIALFRLALWARIAGVVTASLLIIANFLSIPYYPLWSITVIAICTVAVWGLCAVHQDVPH